MAEALALVPTILSLLNKIPEAVHGASELKQTMRQRCSEYESMLAYLSSKPDLVDANGLEHELDRLRDLFTQVKELLRKYTAGPGDGKATRFKIVTRRLAFYKDVLEDLEKVDEDVMRTLTVICSKGAMRTRETVALKTLSVRVEHANAELARIIPHRLPDAAPIPAEAPTFPDCYVQRKHLLDALVDELVSTAVATQPISLVGIGGAGKSILASAIVQHWKVRECYRRGIFWIRAGQRGKDRLVELLQKLVLDLGVAPADVPEQFDANLSDLIVLLDAVATDASSPCLVVLDDVWESEVVETLRQTGLPLLVTTRHASILGSWRRLEEVDRMSEDEAYQVLLKASSIHMSPGEEVTRVIRHVAEDCVFVPLALAVAGSMRKVRGSVTPDAWEGLGAALLGKREAGRCVCETDGDVGGAINAVLEASLRELSATKKKMFMMLAVLAKGTPLTMEMLRNLWDISDMEGARDQAQMFVSRSLLQVSGDTYHANDAILDFAAAKIQENPAIVLTAVSRQARYLGRLHVLLHVSNAGRSDENFHEVDDMWRVVEGLAGDPRLRSKHYGKSLEELEQAAGGQQGQDLYFWAVGRTCEIQGNFEEAEVLYRRAIDIWSNALDPQDPRLRNMMGHTLAFLKRKGKLEEALWLERALIDRTNALEITYNENAL